MRAYRCIAVVCAVLAGLAVMATADEKVDKAIKELDQKFAKINSYTSEWISKMDLDYGSGHIEKTESVTITEWMRKGPKALMRTEIATTTIKTEEGKTSEEKSKNLIVSDGDFYYSVFDQDGQKMVMKSKAQLAKDAHPKALFAQLRQFNTITLLPDEKVGGEDCYVFELKVKPNEYQPETGRSLVYYQKSTGINAKSEGYDEKGKLVSSSLTKDLKINVDISPDRFKFEIPEGAQVTDMTNIEQPTQAKGETKAEETEKEQPQEEPREEPKNEKKPDIKVPKKPKLP
ncbi:MAG: hypothetical protein KJ749_07635 [Planctomycetes bacterium]|nr:hypothetical protein [Planctomycetota bacterium]